MTREELKQHCIRQITEFERIKEIIPVTPNGYKHYKEHKTVLQLIEAIEQQPCEDCISRKDMLAVLSQSHSLTQAWDGLEKLPSVTPKEKIGHWIRQTDDYHDYYECEHCGIAVGLDDIKNFCPNCGARMAEPQESEVSK